MFSALQTDDEVTSPHTLYDLKRSARSGSSAKNDELRSISVTTSRLLVARAALGPTLFRFWLWAEGFMRYALPCASVASSSSAKGEKVISLYSKSCADGVVSVGQLGIGCLAKLVLGFTYHAADWNKVYLADCSLAPGGSLCPELLFLIVRAGP